MSLYNETARIYAPTVFSKEVQGQRKPIGFCREPESGIEVVSHVNADELRRYRQAVADKKEGKL